MCCYIFLFIYLFISNFSPTGIVPCPATPTTFGHIRTANGQGQQRRRITSIQPPTGLQEWLRTFQVSSWEVSFFLHIHPLNNGRPLSNSWSKSRWCVQSVDPAHYHRHCSVELKLAVPVQTKNSDRITWVYCRRTVLYQKLSRCFTTGDFRLLLLCRLSLLSRLLRHDCRFLFCHNYSDEGKKG